MAENQTENLSVDKQNSIESIDLNLLGELAKDADGIEGKYMTFTLKDQVYGLEIQHVREIVDLQKITKIPGMADYIKGLINLRGQVIPVLDIRLRFGIESREYDPRTCIIVVEVNKTMVGLIVDRVADVLIIPSDRIQDPPFARDSGKDRFIKGLGKVDQTVKLLLDIEKLVAQP